MKNLIKFCLVAIMILLPFSCDQDSSDITSSGVESFNKSDSKSTAEVHHGVPFSGNIVGSATLHRSKNSITGNIKTSGLTPGNAYTVWIIIFHAGDVFIDVLYGTGHVIGGNGKANFSVHLNEGDISGTLLPPEANPVGLTDAKSEGIHLLIRDHGPAIPGAIDDQIHTVYGSCDVNTCADVQHAIFMPI